MIECRPIDYQPGTGTRHILVMGRVMDKEDANRLCCQVGDVFLSWEGFGSYTFGKGVTAGYLASKLKLGDCLIDAEALVQLVWHELVLETSPDWPICDHCNRPFYKLGKDERECFCNTANERNRRPE